MPFFPALIYCVTGVGLYLSVSWVFYILITGITLLVQYRTNRIPNLYMSIHPYQVV
jgi:hypothetical protein